jgi:hypothetical protein
MHFYRLKPKFLGGFWTVGVSWGRRGCPISGPVEIKDFCKCPMVLPQKPRAINENSLRWPKKSKNVCMFFKMNPKNCWLKVINSPFYPHAGILICNDVGMARKKAWRWWCYGLEWSSHHQCPMRVWFIKVLQDLGYESPVKTTRISGMYVGRGSAGISCEGPHSLFGHWIHLLFDGVILSWGTCDPNWGSRWWLSYEWIDQTALWTWSRKA